MLQIVKGGIVESDDQLSAHHNVSPRDSTGCYTPYVCACFFPVSTFARSAS